MEGYVSPSFATTFAGRSIVQLSLLDYCNFSLTSSQAPPSHPSHLLYYQTVFIKFSYTSVHLVRNTEWLPSACWLKCKLNLNSRPSKTFSNFETIRNLLHLKWVYSLPLNTFCFLVGQVWLFLQGPFQILWSFVRRVQSWATPPSLEL